MFRKRIRFVSTILVTLIVMSGLGIYTWLQIGPDNNVRMWLSEDSVQSGEKLTLFIRNLGSKSIGYGSVYHVFRISENGTETEMIYDWAWTAELRVCIPFTTQSQIISVDFEPGEYYVQKEYQLLGEDYVQTHRVFSRKLYFTIVG